MGNRWATRREEVRWAATAVQKGLAAYCRLDESGLYCLRRRMIGKPTAKHWWLRPLSWLLSTPAERARLHADALPAGTPLEPFSTEEQKQLFERALKEYLEACANVRYYGDMRFKQLTLFVTLNIALVFAFSQPGRWAAFIVGLLLIFAFHRLEERATAYRRGYMARATFLEEAYLGFVQHRCTRLSDTWTSMHGVRMIFVLSTLAWIGLTLAAGSSK